MIKIETEMLNKIFTDAIVNDKFRHFDDNQAFFNGTWEEYYYALSDHANKLSYGLTKEFNNDDAKWLINYLNLMVIDNVITHFSDIAFHKFFYYYPTMIIDNKNAKEAFEKIYTEINYEKNMATALNIYNIGVNSDNCDDVYGALAALKDNEEQIVDNFFKYALSGANTQINPYLIETYAIKLADLLLSKHNIKVDIKFEDIEDVTILGLSSVKDGSIAFNTILPYIMYSDKAKKASEKIEPTIILDVIFHEVEHTIEKFKPHFDYEYTQSLKDIVLAESLGEKYYSDNYININCEKGIADSHVLKVIEYLNKVAPNQVANYKNQIKNNQNKSTDLRIFNDYMLNIDVLFKSVVASDPTIIAKHPDLLIEYYESGKMKSTARLIHEMHTINTDKQAYIEQLILNRTFDKKGLYDDIILSLSYDKVDSVIFATEVKTALEKVVSSNISKIKEINGNDIFITEMTNNLDIYKTKCNNQVLSRRIDQIENLFINTKSKSI